MIGTGRDQNVFRTENETLNNNSILSLRNTEETRKYYGVIVFICVIFLPGVIGNAHILHIYVTKKKHTNTRVYVIFIAVLDMLNCLVCYPFIIVNCFYPLTFYSGITCRIFSSIKYIVNIAIALTLLVMAVDRFRIIYRPFGSQISKRLSKILCVMVIIVSVVLSLPSSIMYGSVPVKTGVKAVLGRKCDFSETFGIWSLVYVMFLSALSVSEAIVLIVLYSIMGFTIKMQEKLLKETGIETISTLHDLQDVSTEGIRENFKGTKRITIMFFWITLIYIICFLPNPLVRMVMYLQPDWYNNMTLAEHIIYFLAVSTVFLVSATNYFIYIFCDSEFRSEVYKMYQRVFCVCRQKS